MVYRSRLRWTAYGLAGASLALALLLTLVVEPLQDQRPYIMFFPAIMVCAWQGGMALALPAIVLSALAIHVWVLALEPVWAMTLTEGIQTGTFMAVTGGMSWALSALVAARTRFAVTLASIGDAVIVTDRQGRVTFLNAVAAALTGWTVPDALGRDITDVFPIVNMYTRQTVENPVTRVLRTGQVVGLANHTVLLAQDGTERPVDDSGAPICNPAGELIGVVLVFRDMTERQQAEEARAYFAALVASSDDAIISKTLDGIITSWNQGAERLYGYTAAEMVGQPLTRLIPPDLADDFPEILARLRRGERLDHYETQRLAKDGTRLDVSLTISPIRNGAGQLIGASKIARDITARKQAEAAQRLLAEASTLLAASLDPPTQLAQLAQVIVPTLADWCCLDLLQDDGQIHRLAVVHADPARAALAAQLCQNYPRLPRDASHTLAQVLRTGQAWFDPAVSATRLQAEARDAAHLTLVQALGYTAEIVVPLLARGQVLGTLTCVRGKGTRRYSAADLALAEELARRAALALDNARLYQEARAAQAALQAAYTTLEQRVEERTAALRHAMAEQQRLEQATRRAEHLALLGQLAAGVSHEIRNPLGAIFLQVDLLDEELHMPSPDSATVVVEALAAIKTNLARLDDLVQDYLTLARVTSLQRDVQDLGSAIQAWGTEMQPEVEARGVQLQMQGLTGLGPVAFHASTLRRALLNLVQNAVDALPQGGTVTLAGQGTATQVQLHVQDTGSGIPTEHLAYIFEPLYTTKPGGTGLGLYIVREIVAAHGGQLTVESVVGQGTTFTMTLPRETAGVLPPSCRGDP